MTPAQRADLHDFETRPLHFPPEYLQAHPLSQTTRDAVQRAVKIITAIRRPTGNREAVQILEKLNLGLPLEAEETLRYHTTVFDTNDAIVATSNTVWRNDYLSSSHSHEAYYFNEVTYGISPVFAHHLYQERRLGEALQTTLLGLRSSIKNAPEPHVRTPEHAQALATLAAISAQTTTTTDLHDSLLQLRRLRSGHLFPASDYDAAVWALEFLKNMSRDGFSVPLRTGKTAAYYSSQMRRAYLHGPGEILKYLPLDDIRRPYYEDLRDSRESFSPFGMEFSIRESLLLQALNFANVNWATDMVGSLRGSSDLLDFQILFDLAELILAQRILVLEGRTVPTRPSEFTRELVQVDLEPWNDPVTSTTIYLPSIDPYTRREYLYHPESQQFYSVGRDLRDDRCEWLQFDDDRTTGDIFLRRLRLPPPERESIPI